MNKKTFSVLTIVFVGVCAFLFYIFYREAKNTAITKLNEEQMIHAKQAARGIEDFFATWTRSLNSLSRMDEIINIDAVGKRDMKLFYEANQEQITSITRVDERGIIVHNFPIDSSVGADISAQSHIREMLRDHKPVISDVFRAVEGFDAVALHVPVFKGSVFKGTIGILINFESIAKRYLDVIKIGETGHAWVVSRDGTTLYSPIQGLTGKSVFDSIKDSPSLTAMVKDMLKGHEGAALYTSDRTGDRNIGPIMRYAVYMPVHVGSTFWSIAVASAEKDVLSGLISFRNKLALVIGAIFIFGMVFSTLGAKAWLIVKEQEKRKQAEQALRRANEGLELRVEERTKALSESEQRWAATLASIGDAVIASDVAGNITFMNAVAEKLTGWTFLDAVMKPIDEVFNIVNEYTRQRADNPVVKVLKEGMVVGLANHTILVRKDGTEVPIDDSGAPIRDKDGNTTGVVLVFRDISKRKQMEEALGLSEEKFAKAFAINPAAIAMTRFEDGRIMEVNETWSAMFGYNPDEALGSSISASLWPTIEDRARCAKELQEKGTFLGREQALLRRSGESFTALASAQLMNVAGEQVVLSTWLDISDRKRAEEALRESQRLLQDVIDGSPSPIFLKDRDWKFITINTPLEKMLGITREELRGKTDYDIATKEMADYWRSHDEQVMKTGKTLADRRNGGSERRSSCFSGEQVPVGGCFGTDIRGRRHLPRHHRAEAGRRRVA